MSVRNTVLWMIWLLLFTAQILESSGDLNVMFNNTVKKFYKENENISLHCILRGKNVKNSPIFSWHKHIHYGNTSESYQIVTSSSTPNPPSTPLKPVSDDLVISNNRMVLREFKADGRYSVDVHKGEQDFNELDYYLSIKDAKVGDSGSYFCVGRKDNARFQSQQIPIQIAAPILDLKWDDLKPSLSRAGDDNDNAGSDDYDDDDDDDDDDDGGADGAIIGGDGVNDLRHLNEGDRVIFKCRVRGGFPQPRVQIIEGKRDLTHLFKSKVKLNIGDGIKGLQSMSYDTTLTAKNFKVGYDLHKKNVVCRAEMGGEFVGEAGFIKMDDFTVVLDTYRPHFDCPHTMKVKLNAINFTINCVVHAKPGVNNTGIFFKDAENHTKMVANQRGDYWSHVELVEVNGTGIDEQVLMKLVIFRVAKKHLIKYEFIAESELGKTTHIIHLVKADDSSNPSYQQSTSGGQSSNPLVRMTTTRRSRTRDGIVAFILTGAFNLIIYGTCLIVSYGITSW